MYMILPITLALLPTNVRAQGKPLSSPQGPVERLELFACEMPPLIFSIHTCCI